MLSPQDVLQLMAEGAAEIDDDSWGALQNTDPGSNESKPAQIGKKRDRDDIASLTTPAGKDEPSLESILQ